MKTKLKKHVIHRGVGRKPLEYYDTKEVDKVVKSLEVDADIWHSQSQSIKLNADFWRTLSMKLDDELPEVKYQLATERITHAEIKDALNDRLYTAVAAFGVTAIVLIDVCVAYLYSLGVF